MEEYIEKIFTCKKISCARKFLFNICLLITTKMVYFFSLKVGHPQGQLSVSTLDRCPPQREVTGSCRHTSQSN